MWECMTRGLSLPDDTSAACPWQVDVDRFSGSTRSWNTLRETLQMIREWRDELIYIYIYIHVFIYLKKL